MKRKGFTLVELLAVITIMALLGLVIVPVVSSVVNSEKDKLNDIQIATIVKAAEGWSLKNTSYLPDDPRIFTSNETYVLEVFVGLRVLSISGFLESENVANIKEGGNLSGCVKMTFDSAHNQYVYTFINKNDRNADTNCVNDKIIKKLSNGTIEEKIPDEENSLNPETNS